MNTETSEYCNIPIRAHSNLELTLITRSLLERICHLHIALDALTESHQKLQDDVINLYNIVIKLQENKS